MAAVPVLISGVLFDKTNRTQQLVLLAGEISIQGLEVGGGPIIPPAPGNPPGIWGGGNQPFPTPPIPIYPGGTPNPPGIWGPNDPRPGWGLPPHPPDTPVNPPGDDGFLKPPPADGGWGYHPDYGWGYFPGASGAGPK